MRTEPELGPKGGSRARTLGAVGGDGGSFVSNLVEFGELDLTQIKDFEIACENG